MKEDYEGFLQPIIDDGRCIRCNRCRSVCPVLSKLPQDFERELTPKTYACWINDDKIRLRSSSGGLFSAIAMNILDNGGVVFGAAFDENMNLRHIGVENMTDLEKLRRSKYVQSNIGDSYHRVKELLDQGRPVFFVGAPCQIAGLNLFLGADNKNLITSDFICQGVPSPAVFSQYIKYIEKQYSMAVHDINFRDKQKGWGGSPYLLVKFTSGKEVMLTGKMNSYSFGKHRFLRKCCYNCLFKKMPRCGHFTIADFWGIQRKYPREAYKGISCLLVNSRKALENMKLWQSSVTLFKESFSKAQSGNRHLYESLPLPVERTMFFIDFNEKPFASVVNKHLKPPLNVRLRNYLRTRLSLRSIVFMQKCKNLLKN